MNILILGGTGYVGGILKGILSSKGHNIKSWSKYKKITRVKNLMNRT